ncbi:MAG: hypothetical protein ACOYYF_00205 [Chloroflexota bacterium]|nr:hypothetical protein [Chloroflexota bacterium]MBI5702121.1 hypothetical protein [Chloroflexota bacterium]
MRRFLTAYRTPLVILFLAAISALTYLPWVNQISYMNDDWYLMYSANAYGPRAFIDIFSVDRPARAWVMMTAYALFGDNPLYYNLSAYAFRLISALAFFWLLRMLWSHRRDVSLLAALFFLIYPGFLSQINGIDYQSQMVSLAAALLSIALSVRAWFSHRLPEKAAFMIAAALLGWLYLGLVEYFLGFEFLRLGALLILANRGNDSWQRRLQNGIKAWLPNLFIPLAFLVWRLFFFESERGATDIGLQLENFANSPLLTVFWWGIHLAADALDVLWLAWGVPFSNLLPLLRPRHIVSGLVVAVFATYLAYRLTEEHPHVPDEEEKTAWHKEMVFLGLGMLIAGLFPVILVNREVDFVNFTRYSLASAAGASLLMGVFLFHFIPSKHLRWTLIAIVSILSVLTHYANGLQAATQTKMMNEFWWQVSWRVPQIEKGTTLVANYPIGSIQEDYFVWGPANLIYYPKPLDDKSRIRPALFAGVLNDQITNKILVRSSSEYDNRRNIITYADYGNILILSRPSLASCVQLLDGAQPELSAFEENRIMLVAPFSQAGNVLLDAEFHAPPVVVFGGEPPHTWCYYYEKASLARQRGEWDEVIKLGDEALKKNFVPQDPIEWMPFLQAYAREGNTNRLIEIKRYMKKADPFVFLQMCKSLASMQGLDEKTLEIINMYYCAE